jgi:hypothetical protein
VRLRWRLQYGTLTRLHHLSYVLVRQLYAPHLDREGLFSFACCVLAQTLVFTIHRATIVHLFTCHRSRLVSHLSAPHITSAADLPFAQTANSIIIRNTCRSLLRQYATRQSLLTRNPRASALYQDLPPDTLDTPHTSCTSQTSKNFNEPSALKAPSFNTALDVPSTTVSSADSVASTTKAIQPTAQLTKTPSTTSALEVPTAITAHTTLSQPSNQAQLPPPPQQTPTKTNSTLTDYPSNSPLSSSMSSAMSPIEVPSSPEVFLKPGKTPAKFETSGRPGPFDGGGRDGRGGFRGRGGFGQPTSLKSDPLAPSGPPTKSSNRPGPFDGAPGRGGRGCFPTRGGGHGIGRGGFGTSTSITSDPMAPCAPPTTSGSRIQRGCLSPTGPPTKGGRIQGRLPAPAPPMNIKSEAGVKRGRAKLDEDYLSEEEKAPKLLKKDPAPKKPAATEKPAVLKKPAAAKKPAAPKKPAAVKEPVVAEEPATPKELARADEPAAAKEPTTPKEPTPAEEPVASKETAAAKDPVATKETVASKQTVVAEVPAAADEPATKELSTAKEPTSPKEPTAAEEPVASKETVTAEKLAAAKETAATEEPISPKKATAPKKPAVPKRSTAAKKPTKPAPPTPTSTRPTRARKAPERYIADPVITKKKPAPTRKAPAGAKTWQPAHVTTSRQSRLAKVDVFHMLLKQTSWESLSLDQKRELFALLPKTPANKRLLEQWEDGSATPDMRPRELQINSSEFRDDIAEYLDELSGGMWGKRWQEEADVASVERLKGLYDEWKYEEYEAWWGQNEEKEKK